VKYQTLVSIIINNYNYGKFMTEAINSALNQTYKKIEIIVVDDGSTDNSREIIASYGERIIPVYKENGGQPSCYNAGFAASKGEIICFLDSDDIFLPNKIERIVNIFQLDEEIDWCFHNRQLIDENYKPLNYNTTGNDVSGKCDFRKKIQSGKIPPHLPPSSALCFKHSLLEQILPMPTTTKMSASDYYVKYMAVGLSKGFLLGEELTHQRIHGNNAATLQNDKKHLQAREQLFTSLWIRQEFPQFSKFANKICAVGIAINKKYSKQDYDNSSLIDNYLKYVSWNEKIVITILLIYYYYYSDIKKYLSLKVFRA
jgi:glycosyltransferase involved in cell wall biosynthesis